MAKLWEMFIFLLISVFQIRQIDANNENGGFLNKNCITSVDCGGGSVASLPAYYCFAGNKTCQCDVFFHPNRERTKCLGGINQACKYDEHCIEGAFCQQQTKCACKDGLMVDEKGIACSSTLDSKSLTLKSTTLYTALSLFVLLLLM